MIQHRTAHRAQKMAQPAKKTGALMAERATPTRKGPSDAIAAVKPVAPAAAGGLRQALEQQGWKIVAN